MRESWGKLGKMGKMRKIEKNLGKMRKNRKSEAAKARSGSRGPQAETGNQKQDTGNSGFWIRNRNLVSILVWTLSGTVSGS